MRLTVSAAGSISGKATMISDASTAPDSTRSEELDVDEWKRCVAGKRF